MKELANSGGCEVALGLPEEGLLRPACCQPHHPEPKGQHNQSWQRMQESIYIYIYIYIYS